MATVLLNEKNTWIDIKKNKEFKDETRNCVIHDSAPGKTHFTTLTLSQKEKGHSQSGLKRAREWIIARRDEQIKAKFPSTHTVGKTCGTRNELLFNIDHWEENQVNVITLVSKYAVEYSKRELGSILIFSLSGGSDSEVQTVREEIMKMIDRLSKVINNKQEISTTNNTGQTTTQIGTKHGDVSDDKKRGEPHSKSNRALVDNAAQMTKQITPKISNDSPAVTERTGDLYANNASPKLSGAQKTRSKVSRDNIITPDSKEEDCMEPKHAASIPTQGTNQKQSKANQDQSHANDSKPISATVADNFSSEISTASNKAAASESVKCDQTLKTSDNTYKETQQTLLEYTNNQKGNVSTGQDTRYTFLDMPISMALYKKFTETVPFQTLNKECNGLNVEYAKCQLYENQIQIKGLQVKDLSLPDMDALYRRFAEILNEYLAFQKEEAPVGDDITYEFRTHTVDANGMRRCFRKQLDDFEKAFECKVQFTEPTPKGSLTSLIKIILHGKAKENAIKYAYNSFETIFIDYKKKYPDGTKTIQQ